MSTHSYIGYEAPNGTVVFTYCHYDGYLSGVGKDLIGLSREAAIELVDKGGMRCVGEPFGDQGCGHALNAKAFANLVGEDWTEFGYLMRLDGTWAVSPRSSGVLFPLTQEIIDSENS